MYIKVKRIMGIHAAYDTFGEATEKEHKFGKTETKGKEATVGGANSNEAEYRGKPKLLRLILLGHFFSSK